MAKQRKLLKELDWCIEEFKNVICDPKSSVSERRKATEGLMEAMAIKCVLMATGK